MPDIPPGWAVLLAGGLGGLGAIGAACIAAVLSLRTRREVKHVAADTRGVLHQVKNSHSTNMREEQDERHDELVSKIDAVMETQTRHGAGLRIVMEDIGGMRADIRRLSEADLEQSRQAARDRDRIRDLETTKPRFTPKEQQNGNENSGQH